MRRHGTKSKEEKVMKRLFSIFSVALVLLAGCTQINDLDQPIIGGGQSAGTPQFIYAGFAEESRAYVENDTDILWQNGDALSLFYSNCRNVKFEYNGEDGARMAKFDYVYGTGIINDETSPMIKTHALYPYDETASVEYDDSGENLYISTNFPATQYYAPNSFGRGANVMVAATENSTNELKDENLYFRNAGGFFTIKLYGEGVKVRSVKLTARNSERIAGPATIQAFTDEVPVVTMAASGSASVVLDCGEEGVALGADKDHATEFWFALPPTTLANGICIEVTSTGGAIFRKETTKQVVIERNKIKPMAALEFVQSAPTNALWYTLNSGSTSKFDWGTGETLFDARVRNYYYDTANKRFVVEFASPLTTIKEDAFEDVYDLKTIALPQSVTTIEKSAFRNCTGLTSIELSTSLKTIGLSAFYGCTSLQSVTIPASTETIGDDAFCDCTSLKSVRVEDADTPLMIGLSYGGYYITTKRGPFYYSPLQNIYVGRNMQAVYEGNVYNPNGYWDEGMFANEFYDEDNATVTVAIGPKVTQLGNYMFARLPITEVNLPNQLTDIGLGAFQECEKLTSITLPGSLGFVDCDVFYGCTSLNSVRIEYAETPLKIAYTREGSYKYGPFYDSPLREVYCGRDVVQTNGFGTTDRATIPVMGLFANKFAGDTGATLDATIGPKVTSLPSYMFAETPITGVDLPGTLVEIGTSVFESCKSLSAITIPASVALIGKNAFYGCSGLKSLRIEDGDTLLKICYIYMAYYKWGPFYDSPLSDIYCGRNIVQVDEAGEALSPDEWDKGLFAYSSYNNTNLTTKVSVGPKVVILNRFMFSRVRLQYLYIYPSVMFIDHGAFANCALFQGISCNHMIPPSLDKYAFEGCNEMWYIKVPKDSMSAFKGADGWKDFDRNNKYGANFFYEMEE